MWVNFLLTIFIEWPVQLLGLRRFSGGEVLLFGILINGLTWPLAMYAYFTLGWNFWLVEGIVFVVEGLLIGLYWRIGIPRGLLISTIGNGLSMAAGLL